jgi:hypothetical protein
VNSLKVINDHRKIFKGVYNSKPDKIELLEVPTLQFVMQEGQGKLNNLGKPVEDYWAVWKIVNQLKQISKNTHGYQFKLMPHEIVWQKKINEDECIYSEMMQIPDLIDFNMYDEARKTIVKKYRNVNVPETRLIRIEQGLCLQKLHVGHYRDSERTFYELLDYAESKGYKVIGDRREIYLNQPMCQPSPDSWETIIRIQVKAG